ncbi:FTH domain-containing protein [Caenorhabditis elegans]|uniref:FTH domain-containing protein n=1 Tax=Caenorhabditis elegans TaxID=6239 RepID=A0A6J5KFG2_CAEEL|nr:FTH domain-containing protein [Caenorhabditis elegans]CAB4116447.1 FTH domain-containing protein [Caenorhabditis elegans]
MKLRSTLFSNKIVVDSTRYKFRKLVINDSRCLIGWSEIPNEEIGSGKEFAFNYFRNKNYGSLFAYILTNCDIGQLQVRQSLLDDDLKVMEEIDPKRMKINSLEVCINENMTVLLLEKAWNVEVVIIPFIGGRAFEVTTAHVFPLFVRIKINF